MKRSWFLILVVPGVIALAANASSIEPPGEGELPLLLKEDFENGADRWQPFDPTGWRIESIGGNHVYNQFKAASTYKPPFRSPFNIAMLKDYSVSTFKLDAQVKSTIADYPHRDVCVVFGYQDAGHFYYVHFGKTTDDHANQIFIVNGAARKKISTKTTTGTPWNNDWHHVRILRNAVSGKIEVFFDDMKEPAKIAMDTTFTWGRIGVGSFDDTSMWDDIILRGEKAEPKGK